jgi:hypothetical protein
VALFPEPKTQNPICPRGRLIGKNFLGHQVLVNEKMKNLRQKVRGEAVINIVFDGAFSQNPKPITQNRPL